MFNKKCGEIISFMPIFFVKQSLLFFNSSRCYCWGEEVKTLTIFSTLAKNSVKFFSQKGFTSAFLLLFATYQNLAAIVATRRA